MKRIVLSAALAIVLMLVASATAGADGLPVAQGWTGGNGWCTENVCFRAWPVAGGVLLHWIVEGQPAPALRLLRLSPQNDAGEILAASSSAGEFSLFDSSIETGTVYLYQLLAGEQPLGDPLEAGIAVQRTDPGDGERAFRVFVPLAL